MNWIISGAIRVDSTSQSESLEGRSPVVILPGGQVKQPQFELEFSSGILSVEFRIVRAEDDSLGLDSVLCSIGNMNFTVERLENSLRFVEDDRIDGDLRLVYEPSNWPRFILNMGAY